MTDTSIVPGVTVTGSTSTAPSSYPAWEYQVLSGLGAPANVINLLALHLWANSEGVNPANNNWLATSLKGAQYPTSGIVAENGGNAIPAYSTQATGVAATVATIRGYPAIVAALVSGSSLSTIYQAINASSWCKGCQSGHYPTALAAWLGGGNPKNAAAGSTTIGASSSANQCAWSIGPWCVLSSSEAKKVLGGLMVVTGVGTMALGLILVFAFGLTATKTGAAAVGLAGNVPGPVGGAARGVRTLGGGGGRRRRSSSSAGSSGGPPSSSPAADEPAARARHAPGANRPGGPGAGQRRGSGVPARRAIAAHKADQAAEDRYLMGEAREADRRADRRFGPGTSRRGTTSDLRRGTP